MTWGVCIGLVLVVAVWVWAFSQFEIPQDAKVTEHVVSHAGNRLSGSLVIPEGPSDMPVVLIVHGDGPQNRWSDSTYLPLIRRFLDAGIGVFSWDKPGVGASTGDWLSQSMQMRADEAAAVYAYLRDSVGIAPEALGFLGFSQAGWVVPQASIAVDAHYAVLVGPAANWRRQGAYLTARRLEAAGLASEAVVQQVGENLAQNDALFRGGGTCASRPDLGHARCEFVRRNYEADTTQAVLDMRTPLLVLVGAQDLNVDPHETAEVFGQNPRHEVKIVPEATHSLLRAQPYNFQQPQDWTVWTTLRFVLAGQHAYAPGVLDHMTTWVLDQHR
ncbi:hypothetical protein So717_38290 [Roseobacter cerasinus]|uniref:Serine aminopeptidase S33 domain-containing protein n=1 Tax=Roseobacter cerasinus TaxID=2602289 RepID=A0A640W0T1_9RHOB|nr:alpha/beta fold hydrolase [Roseobacter cerasinus]GFE52076.1 hypothetical protein So717_38290 [Roseobacter cerasinus]